MIKASDYTTLADAAEQHFSETNFGEADAHQERTHACALILAALGLRKPSEESLAEAEGWYNDMDKGLMVERCAQWGIDLHRDASTLVGIWADIAMHLFAARRDAGLPVWPQ